MTRSIIRRAFFVSLVILSASSWPAPIHAQSIPDLVGGDELYGAACAGCHGADGRGLPEARLGFDIPVPDFTDCQFAPREPDSDWYAVAHSGGPARGFDRMMPAFGGALTDEQYLAILQHIRRFCTDPSWPRGELNLPRAMFTEKAFPEDEWVWTTGVHAEGPATIANEFIYEKRLGARNQIELVIPFEVRNEEGDAGWRGGLGDVAVGLKRVLFDNFGTGTILSLTGEVILPTGNHDRGFGAGVARFEPFLSAGQIFPADVFLHLQAGAEIPTSTDRAEREAFWRGALGKSFTEGRFGRSWSPMIEVLGARELSTGANVHWDIVPQFHVTLNQRQHVMANVAVRVPITEAESRPTQLLVFLLLDWFDGGFFDGW